MEENREMRTDGFRPKILQEIGVTSKLALPALIALCSIAPGKPTVSNLAVLGEISI